MATLLTLPNELTHQICIFTDCDDLLSLSMTNTSLHRVAQLILKYHREQWFQFSTFSDTTSSTILGNWHAFTYRLLTDSSSPAPYIRHLSIGFTPNAEALRTTSL
ncbi:hypothetical protein K469DRAFT_775096 [Zopfia rhizophila CBS 207.26]|uniref:F-box domain-containing protein n=1 Tax=Zopfia rhizophila CBS 207.26 TaxID=1314779 RepID=A0A6A6E3S3_9PEZI|nr:hypothetical protein K469DRAFT_775096 [Zopfia rhizophila CBS 207.26]